MAFVMLNRDGRRQCDVMYASGCNSRRAQPNVAVLITERLNWFANSCLFFSACLFFSVGQFCILASHWLEWH